MINWDRVEELQGEVGADAFGEVVEIFLEEAAELIQRLTSPDRAQCLADDLHFMKGSALSLGFSELATLCQKGEAQARNANADAVDIAEIVDNFEQSRLEFLNGLARDTAA